MATSSWFSLLHRLLIISTLVAGADAISFNFIAFSPNAKDINYTGDAFPSQNVIQLTKNQADGSLKRSVGRAVYYQPVRLWDRATGATANFTTHFEFMINALNTSVYGEGMAFLLSPLPSDAPLDAAGGYLGLVDPATDGNSSNQIVAVEFDTFQNEWDDTWDHVGIDVNSVHSVVTKAWLAEGGLKSGQKGDAWISYSAEPAPGRLLVFLSYDGLRKETPTLDYEIELKKYLPEWVGVGFSASTGESTEIHNLLSWDLNVSDLSPPRPATKEKGSAVKTGLLVVLIIVVVAGVVGLVCWVLYRKYWFRHDAAASDIDVEIDGRLAPGPRRFMYSELNAATKGFSDKLGQGGFGGVFYGELAGTKQPVAVKRVARGSQQGKKEYISEIIVISRLRHRNLVRLVGWCHEREELLLVYEHMHNGSLDHHLFNSDRLPIEWVIRYKISTGLACALLYLHEEWEQQVVHRDVKASNIMLDANFDAKLGDFGLARLVEHGNLDSATTIIAGTMGYLAPECLMSGKCSAESDVFSFGAVALETACGRRPIFESSNDEKNRLVEWVWDLYGKGRHLDAMDERLNGEYKEEEAEVLLIVGLWCSHPDPTIRPTMRQVVRCLRFEAPLPKLPSTLPIPMYSPFMQTLVPDTSISTSIHDTNTTTTTSTSNWTRTYSSCSIATTASDKGLLMYSTTSF